MRAFSMHHAVKCQGAASYHAFSQQRRLPVLSDLFVVWSGVHVSCTSHQLDRSRSPKMHCIHLLVIIGERERSLPSRPNGAIFLLFIYIFISGVDVCRNVLRNSK